MKKTVRFLQIFLPSLIIGVSAIITAAVIVNGYTYKFRSSQTITVTGLAEKNFASDLIVWRGAYQRKSLNLKEAYKLIKDDEINVKRYLKANHIEDKEIVFSSIDIQKIFQEQRDDKGNRIGSVFAGYQLTQSVTVESNAIERVELVSREVTQLIESGIEISSMEPSYFYTKLSELKIDLLAKASADARKRAQTIAENSGSKLGKILKADMGVFQITAPNSNEDFSYGGAFNTSSKNKKASITIRINYAVK